MYLAGCRAWCPTDLPHLCCKALINKINMIPIASKIEKIFLCTYLHNSVTDAIKSVSKINVSHFLKSF